MSKTLEKHIQQIKPYTYNTQDVLGKGYSSLVYKGKNSQTNQKVAIKTIQKQQKKSKLHQKMILNQIQILKQLKNQPHIVKLYDIKQTRNHTYIITQYCNQGTLKRYMEKKKGLTEQQAVSIFKQILKGYESIYVAGIIHRDIKPANILMKSDEVRIADFGFAIPINQILSEQSLIIGSPMYMPYQALKKKIYSFKGDIWALGITFYEMLTGQSLFKAKTEKQLIRMINYSNIQKMISSKINQKLKHILVRMLTLDMNQRATFEQVKQLMFGEQKTVPMSLLKKNKISESEQRDKTETKNTIINLTTEGSDAQIQEQEPKEQPKEEPIKDNKKPQKIKQNVQKVDIKAVSKKQTIIITDGEKLQNDSTLKILQQENKKISYQLISQIHFCRFAYKLLTRMINSSSRDISENFQQNIKGLICKKIDQIQICKLVSEKSYDSFKASKYGKQIENIVKQYKARYDKQVSFDNAKWTNYKQFQYNIDSEILNAYNHISQLNNPQQSSELIIILDYMVTLKQLTRLMQKQNLDQFHKNSKIQKIVEGVPSKNITMQHVKAIKQKLKGIKLI